MVLAHLITTLIGLAGDAAPAPKAPPTDAEVRQAVERSVVYLQEEAVDWIHDRKCASCHHAPMMIWALNEAKTHGYAIDQAALDEVTSWTAGDMGVSKSLVAPDATAPSKSDKASVVPLDATYLALAIGSIPSREQGEGVRKVMGRIEARLVGDQQADGSWAPQSGRPPLFGSQEEMTLINSLALGTPPETVATETKSPASEGRKRAVRWLRSHPVGVTNQAQVLRLLFERRAGKSREELQGDIQQLVGRQNPDGGWGQEESLPSDAYATGQALYALGRAGLEPDRPEIGRARAFLVASQTPDGSWPMASRPIQKGGAGAKDLSPITFLGTAWATLGLLQSFPR